MKTIEIIDSGQDKYTLKYDTNILGRRYDNIAETITIVKPTAEVDSLNKYTYVESEEDVLEENIEN